MVRMLKEAKKPSFKIHVIPITKISYNLKDVNASMEINCIKAIKGLSKLKNK